MEKLGDLLMNPSGERYLVFHRPAGASGLWENEVDVSPGTVFLSITLADERAEPSAVTRVELTVDSPMGTFGIGKEVAPGPDAIQNATERGYALIVNRPTAGLWRLRVSAQNASAFTCRLQTFVEAPADSGPRVVLHAQTIGTAGRSGEIPPETFASRGGSGVTHNAITSPGLPDLEMVFKNRRCEECKNNVTEVLLSMGLLILMPIMRPGALNAASALVQAMSRLLGLFGIILTFDGLADAILRVVNPDMPSLAREICKAAGRCN